jgi:hypothetical protein
MLCAFLPFLLTGCASSNDIAPLPLPGAPAHLRACAAAETPLIPGDKGTPLTKAEAAEALAEQRAGALAAHRCAASWQAFYDDLRKSFGGS